MKSSFVRYVAIAAVALTAASAFVDTKWQSDGASGAENDSASSYLAAYR